MTGRAPRDSRDQRGCDRDTRRGSVLGNRTGGDVEVNSVLGQGSTFTVAMTLQECEAPATQDDPGGDQSRSADRSATDDCPPGSSA